MYDYMKLRIYDHRQIASILNNSKFEFQQRVNISTSEVYSFPQFCKWNVFEIQVYSPSLLEIRGSLHRFWNNGTNENDFPLTEVKKAITRFCEEFNLNPFLAHITNLEYGV